MFGFGDLRSLRRFAGVGKPAVAAIKAARDAGDALHAVLRTAHDRAEAAAAEFAAGRWRGARAASPIADPAAAAAFEAAWAEVERLRYAPARWAADSTS